MNAAMLHLLGLRTFFISIALSSINGYDWLQYGFDSFRSGYNPYESSITISNFQTKTLKNTWEVSIGSKSSSQPLYVENILIDGSSTSILYVATDDGYFYGINALNGKIIWKKYVGAYTDTNCEIDISTSSTALIDKSTSSISAQIIIK